MALNERISAAVYTIFISVILLTNFQTSPCTPLTLRALGL